MSIPLRGPRLEIDVAVSDCPCAAPGCDRTTAPGETLIMRQIAGMSCFEPLCAAHGAEAVEDARLRARLWMHEEKQRREGLRAP